MRLCDDIYTTCFRVHVLLEHVNSETGAVCRQCTDTRETGAT
jgi:hypothetical protein